MKTNNISRFILKKWVLIIPEIILKQDFLLEFDAQLQTNSPMLVSHFLKKVAKIF